jgi:hypothetical protein
MSSKRKRKCKDRTKQKQEQKQALKEEETTNKRADDGHQETNGGGSSTIFKKKHKNEQPDSDDNNSRQQASALCQQARSVWLNASSQEEMEQVIALYRRALNMKSTVGGTNSSSYAALPPSEYKKAGERLSLLYVQSDQPVKAKVGMRYLGYTCMLSSRILNYPLNANVIKNNKKKNYIKKNPKPQSTVEPPCCIYDNFLSPGELQYLQSVFSDIKQDYWTLHKYSVEPPSPYFSYVKRIQHDDGTFMSYLVKKIQKSLRTKFPSIRQARYVEMWSHNRPHSTGHQLHFDSDNEGLGEKIKNPLVSTILYLNETAVEGEEIVGGPSLITNQLLTSTSIKRTKGWLAYPQPCRLVAFDGKVLHGVIPGKGYVGEGKRRVTLMIAFWKHIQIRKPKKDTSGETMILPGAAMPWPMTAKTTIENNKDKGGSKIIPFWAQRLNTHMNDMDGIDKGNSSMIQSVDPIPLKHVYEDLDGNPWNDDVLPEYDQVYQGF